jgi:DNA-binding CsgD family transcriptional regulator
MRGLKPYSDLIEYIYDAALEPERWTDVVARVNEFVGGHACGLFSKHAISKFGVTHYYCGADPHYIQLYADTHCKFDPLTTLPRFGEVVSIPDLVPYDEYRRGRFYQEWLRPQGCVDAANVVLEQSTPNCPVLMTVLSRRMVDAEMLRRISLVVPHAHRALMINKSIERRQSETAVFAEVLDGLSAGIFLVDAGCRIVHTNAAADAMLRSDDFLRSVNGQLVARNAQAHVALREIFTGNADLAIAKGTAVPLTAHDGACYLAHVLPLQSVGRSNPGLSQKAVAALFVRKVEVDTQSGGEIIARTFELTPAELRVLLAIAEGGGVAEASGTLGVAETTIKTHLHRVFAKTGASRQADLVKLAAGYTNPLAH